MPRSSPQGRQRAKRAINAQSKRIRPPEAGSWWLAARDLAPRTCAPHVQHVCSPMCSPCAPVCFCVFLFAPHPLPVGSGLEAGNWRREAGSPVPSPMYTCAVRALPCARMRSSCKITPLRGVHHNHHRPTADSRQPTADGYAPRASASRARRRSTWCSTQMAGRSVRMPGALRLKLSCIRRRSRACSS